MLRSIRDACRRLHDNEAGNIAIMFSAAMIPLLLIMGGAIDFTRYNGYKAHLSNAVDAAALALARNVDDFDDDCPEPEEGAEGVFCEEATEATEEFIATLDIPDDRFSIESLEADRIFGGFIVTAEGQMITEWLPLGDRNGGAAGVMSMDMEVIAQVQQSSNRVELALVIDNTGSMNCGNTMSGTCYNNYTNPGSSSRIVAVKAAATTLVNTLMRDNLQDPTQIRIALVPFEGTVNVGITSGPANSWAQPPSWIAWNTTSSTTNYSLSASTGVAVGKYNGVDFERYNVQSGATGCSSGTNCRYIGHGYLFRKVDVLWAGCVQMRPSSATPSLNYELTDITPNTNTPNSLFVPYFWPDEPDSSGTYSGNAAGYTFTNNYLSDLANASGSGSTRALNAQASLAKFRPNTATKATWQSATMKTQAATARPYITGPNRGCPTPIVPLTNGTAAGKTTILNAINNMVAYYSNGTYIPTGLMWGWHVLSPTLPFTEGIAPGAEDYDRTVKAIVLFTDGDNTVNATSPVNPNGSFYSAWSYVVERDPDNVYRLGSNTTNAETALNTKTATACTNAKAAGIRVYTIAFGDLTTATRTMMEDCATEDDGEPLYYHAPTTSALEDIFRRIGDDLSEIHLSM